MMKKTKRFTIVLAAMLLLGAVAGCSNTGVAEIKPLSYALYEKKGNLYYSALNGSEDVLLSKNLTGDEEDYNFSLEYGVTTTLSENQKRLFYVKMSEELYSGTLYYRDVLENGELSDEVRIGKDTFYYKVSADGNHVVYMPI